jgi:hypothetical protein
LFCLIVVAAQFTLPPGYGILVYVGLGVANVVSAIFVFLLATRLYGNGMGIFLAIMTLIPYLGLIFLLIVNGRATKVLKDHDIPVGLLGADMSKLK